MQTLNGTINAIDNRIAALTLTRNVTWVVDQTVCRNVTWIVDRTVSRNVTWVVDDKKSIA